MYISWPLHKWIIVIGGLMIVALILTHAIKGFFEDK
jgi:hypothetical protein